MPLEFNMKFREYDNAFLKRFGERFPTRIISPESVTNEQVYEAMDKSFAAGRNLLPEIFGYADHPKDIVY